VRLVLAAISLLKPALADDPGRLRIVERVQQTFRVKYAPT
jgi:hypothetical protein